MIKHVGRFILGILLTTPICASAQAQSLTSEGFDVRNRLEADIQKNLQSLISTRLDSKKFTVAVRAKISPVPPPKPNEPPKKDELPAGMDLGTIDVRELLASYERQIEEIKLRHEASEKKNDAPKFQVNQIEVVVGLDESFGDSYIAEFNTWLKKKMTSDYGSIAKAVVGKVKLNEDQKLQEQKQEEKEKQEQALQQHKVELDARKDFLLPIAVALLALGIIVAMFLAGRAVKNGLAQMALSQKSLALEQKGDWLFDRPTGELEDSAGGGTTENLSGSITQLFEKVASICMEINGNLNDLVRVWMDTGERGYLKTALLIDTLVSAKTRILQDSKSIGPVRIPLDDELMQSRSEELTQAFNKMTELEDTEKHEILEELYWNLVSVRTLGIQSLRVPFDFLQGLDKDNVLSILESQREDTRAIAVAYLPEATKSEVLGFFDEEKKTALLRNMLSTDRVPEKQVWDIDTALKVVAINQNSGQKEKFVSIFPRTMEILQTLDLAEEIRILRRISGELPDRGEHLKRHHSTFAFIDEWKPEYIRKLAQVASADELQTVIRQIPSAQEMLLAECPPKIKTIIEDDLKITSIKDDGASAAKLKSLKNKWNRIVVGENLPMSRVIKSAPTSGGAHAA